MSEEFRQQATVVFRVAVAVLLALSAALAVVGWLVGGWWGLLVGVVLALILLACGLTAAVLFYAMSQDGA